MWLLCLSYLCSCFQGVCHEITSVTCPDGHTAAYTPACTQMSLCINMAGFGTIPLHCGRRAVLALGASKADGSVVAIKYSCSLSVARL